MSTKASISSSDKHHLYEDLFLDVIAGTVWLEITNPTEFRVQREDCGEGKSYETVTVEIPDETMDQIAIDWIKKRGLQGDV